MRFLKNFREKCGKFEDNKTEKIMVKILKVIKYVLGVEDWKTSNEIITELKGISRIYF